MTDYDNTNRGAAWKRDRKSENHPYATGEINVQQSGANLISVWVEQNPEGGRPMFKFSVTPKEQQVQPSGSGGNQFASQQAAPPAQPDFEDDIPF